MMGFLDSINEEMHWKAICLFFNKGKMSDLEFRLYWGIPAWLYYKWSRYGGKPIKFRRYINPESKMKTSKLTEQTERTCNNCKSWAEGTESHRHCLNERITSGDMISDERIMEYEDSEGLISNDGMMTWELFGCILFEEKAK